MFELTMTVYLVFAVSLIGGAVYQCWQANRAERKALLQQKTRVSPSRAEKITTSAANNDLEAMLPIFMLTGMFINKH